MVIYGDLCCSASKASITWQTNLSSYINWCKNVTHSPAMALRCSRQNIANEVRCPQCGFDGGMLQWFKGTTKGLKVEMKCNLVMFWLLYSGFAFLISLIHFKLNILNHRVKASRGWLFETPKKTSKRLANVTRWSPSLVVNGVKGSL